MERVRFGVNYTPSKNWLYSWIDWDDHSVELDLDNIASIGLDHLRVHCIWPLFQCGQESFNKTDLPPNPCTSPRVS